MTRQAGIYGITALVGLAVGLGFGVLITKQKINAANKTISQLQTEQADSQQKLSAASTELTKVKTDLLKFRDEAVRLNSELMKAKAETDRMKAVLAQMMEQGQGSAPPSPATPPASTAAAPGAKPAAPTPTAPVAGVREYTIQDGDSLWVIAANQLGSGIRYKEILKLNPQLTENTTLKVGSKIKIPAK